MAKRLPTLEEVESKFLNLWIGQTFTDHRGRTVEKISDTEISLGIGYNNVLRIAEYIAAVYAGQEFGRYVVPGFDGMPSWEFSYA